MRREGKNGRIRERVRESESQRVRESESQRVNVKGNHGARLLIRH